MENFLPKSLKLPVLIEDFFYVWVEGDDDWVELYLERAREFVVNELLPFYT